MGEVTCPRPRHEMAYERGKQQPMRDFMKRGLDLGGLRGVTIVVIGSSPCCTSLLLPVESFLKDLKVRFYFEENQKGSFHTWVR